MAQTSLIIAVIPARGGSKGIPHKNVRLIVGKPLLAHSILHARQASAITRIVVSTDDAEISAVSREWGAEVVPRPPEISGDKASSESALLHTLDWLLTTERYEPELVVFLQATSPMRAPDDIQRAIETLKREGADSLFSACRVEGFTWRLTNGAVAPVNYEPAKRPLRQELKEEIWEENGSFYIFKPWVLRKLNSRLGGQIAMHKMSRLNSFQIDEPGDFELIEHLMAFGKAESRKQKTESGEQRAEDGGQRTEDGGQRAVVNGQLSCIKLLVLDFDGVLTDNRVLVSEDGIEAVLCDRSDGLGLERLKRSGIEVIVLSKEKNPVVAARCRKLGIECIQGCDDKLEALKKRAEGGNLKPEKAADRGDFQPSAFSLQPSPAAPQVSGLILHPSPAGPSGFRSQPSSLASSIAYVGNDVNDLECLRWVGLPIAVAGSAPEVLAAAKWVTSKPGGHGAVREICDLLLRAM